MEKNYAPRWTILIVSPVTYLNDVYDTIWDFSWLCLDDILDLKLMLEWVKTLRDVGMGLMYFVHGKYMNLGGCKGKIVMGWTVPPPQKKDMLKF